MKSRVIAPAATDLRVGAVCMVIATQMLPLGDTFTKLLTGYLPTAEVALWRTLAQAAILGAIAGLWHRRLRGAMFSPIVAAAGACFLITLASLIGAFAVMPIATAIAIFFVEPLILTLLSGPLLGERVGPRRYAAVAVGLLGALIVIRPGAPAHGAATFLPLVAALAFALNSVLVRKALRSRSPLTVQCGTAIYAAAFIVLAHSAFWLWGGAGPVILSAPPAAPLLVLAAGVTAAASFLLIANAFARVEASLLAPFQYLEIVGATVFGLMVFGEFPDALTWLGTAIILASGGYTFHRERIAQRQRAGAPTAAGN